MSNLGLLCERHHTLLHAHGFQLTLHPDRSLTVRSSDNTPITHHPALPWNDSERLDPLRRITADTLPTDWNGDRMDLSQVAWVMLQHAA